MKTQNVLNNIEKMLFEPLWQILQNLRRLNFLHLKNTSVQISRVITWSTLEVPFIAISDMNLQYLMFISSIGSWRRPAGLCTECQSVVGGGGESYGLQENEGGGCDWGPPDWMLANTEPWTGREGGPVKDGGKSKRKRMMSVDQCCWKTSALKSTICKSPGWT